MRRFVLDRRALLRGTGAAVALPILEAMLDSHGAALAAGTAIPKRFATYFFGNGVIRNRWTPTSMGAGWALTEELAPLANVKSYVNVVSGYNVKVPAVRLHHVGASALLSGTPIIPIAPGNANYASKFGGITIDQIAANTIGQGTRFSSLQLRISRQVTSIEGPTLNYISHRGPDSPLPPEASPAALFNRLFTHFTAPNTADPTYQLRANVLDAVREDAKRLSSRLGAADRARLDQHLTGLSELRSQIVDATPLPSSCTKPGAVSDRNESEQLQTANRLMADVLAAAWACDLTRVASIQLTGSVGGTVLSNLGLSSTIHDLTHDAGRQGDVHRCVVFCVQQFAYFLERLKATPDGTGNLLDNSCILFTSDVAEGLNHTITDYPILVAGRASGLLRYPGVHVRSTSGENTSNVLLSCLKAVGAGVGSVGSAGGYSSTVCSGIMA